MAAYKRTGDRPGIFSLLRNQQASGYQDSSVQRETLYYAPQAKRQLGSVDPAVNLLMTTLAVVAVTLPPGVQLTQSAPQLKRHVQVDVFQRPLTLGINPNPASVILDCSAPAVKPAVQVDFYPNLLTSTLAPATVPVGRQLTDSAPPLKYAVQVDFRANMLVLGINPNPRALIVDASAPPPKYAIQVDLFQNPAILSFTQPTFPPGMQLSDSATTVIGKYQTQIDFTQNLLGLNPPPEPPIPPLPSFVGTGGGGAAYRCPQGWVWDPKKNACRKLTLIEQPHRHLKQLLDEIGADILYGELTQPAASAETQAKAAKLVKPFSDDKKAAVPDAQAIDWAALERDAKRTASLVKLWLAQQHEREIMDEDDEFLFFQ